ncbi:hypothetical protein ACFQZV_02870 [Microbacterium koreense]|uniref:ABC transporter permease n=1 Tax=Microbacterium koreense TaxID=323761 RepID=A0ABW2ZNX5_9MICO
MNRTLNVIRMQFVNKQTYIWVPLIVLGASFLISLAIFAMIPYDGPKAGGGSQAPLWYFLVVGVQSLTLTFPFSQAMSVTRREYFFGTLLTAAVTALMLAIVFVLGGLVEQATDGWGINGYFFYLDWLWEGGPWAALLEYFVIAMLFFVIGFGSAMIYKRFGGVWLTVVLVGAGLLLVAAIFFISRFNAWGDVFVWLQDAGALGLIGIGAIAAAVISGLSFVGLRRATP